MSNAFTDSTSISAFNKITIEWEALWMYGLWHGVVERGLIKFVFAHKKANIFWFLSFNHSKVNPGVRGIFVLS